MKVILPWQVNGRLCVVDCAHTYSRFVFCLKKSAFVRREVVSRGGAPEVESNKHPAVLYVAGNGGGAVG